MTLTTALIGTGIIDNAESTTGWSHVGSGGISISLDTDIPIQGSGCIAIKVSTTRESWVNFDIGSGNELDYSGGGAEEGELFYVWVNIQTPGFVSTVANDGFALQLGTTQSNFARWCVGSSDQGWINDYGGGWYCFVCDPASTPTHSGGTGLTLSSVRYFGVYYKGGGAAVRQDNVFVDTIGSYKGVRLTGTDTAGWKDAVDYCTDYTNRAWGILQRDPKGLYHVLGNIVIGDTAQSAVTSLKDTNRIFVIDEMQYFNSSGTKVQTIPDGTGISIEDHASWTTTFEDGLIVGTDRGRSGSIFLGPTTYAMALDFASPNNAASVTRLYGTQFLDITDSIVFKNDADHRAYSVTFKRCAQVDPVGAIEIRGCSFVEYTADTGAALKWNANADVEDCLFAGNTDVTNDPHGIEFPTAGTFAQTGNTFAGNDFDINNSSVAVLVDSYQPTEDGDVDVYSGSIIRVAQQFTGTAGTLTRAIFSIRKQGSPTGNITATLYANSGGAPTGTALATSEPVAIAGLTTSFADVEFEFEDEVALSGSTEYHIAIEYSGGDATNRLEVEYLTAGSGSETCNTYTSSWGSQTYDCRFAVNRDGLVKINATNSNPGTAEETASVRGATKIVNSVTLTIECLDTDNQPIQNVQCSIFRTSDGQQLMNEDTLASGLASEGFNYLTDTPIYWRARKSEDTDNPRYKPTSGTGTIKSGGFSVTTIMREVSVPI